MPQSRIKKQQVVAWTLVVVCAIAIFIGSSKSAYDLDSGNGLLSLMSIWLKETLFAVFGKPIDPSPIGHFCEYLLFGGLLANALRLHVPTSDQGSVMRSERRVLASAVIIAALYAVSDEFHQLFVPGRVCDPADFAVDICAAFIGALIVVLVTRARGQRLT